MDEEEQWPLGLLRSRLEALALKEPEKGFAVLLTTGAMNPPHRGHAQLLHQAAERVEAAGFAVAGAWMSPSHDGYVQPKASSLGTIGLSGAFRLELARRVTEGDPLVAVGSWEASPARPHWPDFPEVARSLHQFLAQRAEGAKLKGAHGHVQLFYCCGTDHAAKCGLYRGMGADRGIGVVVVPRAGEEPRAESTERLVFVAQPAEGEVAAVSSTKLRIALEHRDAAALSVGMSPAAAGLMLEPSQEQLEAFEDDFEKLAALKG